VTARTPALRHGAPVLVAVVAAFVFTRALGTRTNYDEGVYLASLQLLRHGEELGRDVYTPQPPVFYWLLRALAAPFGQSIEGIRAAFVGLAVAGVLGAFAAARVLWGLGAGLAASLIVVIAPPFPTTAPTVAADIPSLALALHAHELAACASRERASPVWGGGAGALIGFAVLTKFLAAPFLVPVLVLPLAARRGRRVVPWIVCGGCAAVLVVALVHLGSLHELWRGAVTDHEGAKSLSSVHDNVLRLRHLLEWRTPFGWLVPAGAVAFVLSRDARRVWPLATVVPAAAAFTLYVRPLPDHQLSMMSSAYALSAGPALALGIGALRGRLRAVAAVVLAVFVVAGVYQEQRRLVRNDVPEPAKVIWGTAAVEQAVNPGEVFTTDEPVVSFRATRLIPGGLTDTSATRVDSRALTTAHVLREIEASRSKAVLVARMFLSLPDLRRALERRFPVRRQCAGATLYLPAQPPQSFPRCPV
jgi:4-amino-4-deoxy-L-arabinose transferase-like glycosyltransferase